MAHPIEMLMSSVLENLKKMVDANTVIGEPINLPNGVSIIPVTKLNCGFGCGGGEYGQKAGVEKAVSYTHLDVYKRQVYRWFISCF